MWTLTIYPYAYTKNMQSIGYMGFADIIFKFCKHLIMHETYQLFHASLLSPLNYTLPDSVKWKNDFWYVKYNRLIYDGAEQWSLKDGFINSNLSL